MNKKFMFRVLATFFFLSPGPLIAHGGGLDGNGGHLNHKTLEYHCHREPCFSKQQSLQVEPEVIVPPTSVGDLRGLSCERLLPFGTPSNEDSLLCKRYFVIGHSCALRSARWVAYFVDENNPADLNVERSNNFRKDPELEAGCRKELHDFGGGFDRGHLVSSETLDWDAETNSETFLLSNMAPQLAGFNRAIWRGLENREREWSKRKGKLYVLTGPVFYNSTLSMLNRVPIPSHFYKIIFNPRDRKVLSFLIPHDSLKTASLGLYTVSVDDIEQATELDFFSDFSDREENLLESKVSSLNW